MNKKIKHVNESTQQTAQNKKETTCAITSAAAAAAAANSTPAPSSASTSATSNKSKIFSNFKPSKPSHKVNFIFAILKEAKDDSDNPIKFLANLYSILFSSLFIIILLMFAASLPIAMLVIGFINLNECSIDFKIPIWLIVFGCVSLFHIVTRIVASIQLRRKNRMNKSHLVDPIYVICLTLFVGLFQFIWFIIGNSWVYSVKNVVFSKNERREPGYCNPVCYMMAYWSIIGCWILAGLFLLFLTGLVLFFVCSLIFQKYFKRDKLKNIRK